MTVSTHSARYPYARRSTLEHLAKQEKMSAALRAELRRIERSRRWARVKQLLTWPASVWRW